MLLGGRQLRCGRPQSQLSVFICFGIYTSNNVASRNAFGALFSGDTCRLNGKKPLHLLQNIVETMYFSPSFSFLFSQRAVYRLDFSSLTSLAAPANFWACQPANLWPTIPLFDPGPPAHRTWELHFMRFHPLPRVLKRKTRWSRKKVALKFHRTDNSHKRY